MNDVWLNSSRKLHKRFNYVKNVTDRSAATKKEQVMKRRSKNYTKISTVECFAANVVLISISPTPRTTQKLDGKENNENLPK